MNIASIAGFVLCFGVILLGIASNGGISSIYKLLNIPSMLVTFGGSFLSVLASADSFGDYLAGLKGFPQALKKSAVTPGEIVKGILDLSGVARKEGLLALEGYAESLENQFLKKGIRLIVDGIDPELVKNIMETEMLHKEDENRRNMQFWGDLAAMGPAWGMVGTLLGLINMLRTLDDVANLGSGMALALITTLYGSVLANLLLSVTGFQWKNLLDIKGFCTVGVGMCLLSVPQGRGKGERRQPEGRGRRAGTGQRLYPGAGLLSLSGKGADRPGGRGGKDDVPGLL